MFIMKNILFYLSLVFGIISNVSAQNAVLNHVDTSVKQFDLGNVIIKSYKLKEYSNKIKERNILLVFNGPKDSLHHGWDSTYFLTRFPTLDDVPVKLCKVTCRLKPFDTTLFTPQIVFFQATKGDTLFRAVDIHKTCNVYKHTLVIDLANENIKIQPGEFFLGYGFVTKNHDKEFHYRLYSTNRRGGGVMLTFTKGMPHIISDDELPYAFPFKITYLRL